MKITKEELIEKNAELKHDNERLTLQDQLIRREFAKAFSWYKPKRQYDTEQELSLPSWEQIFVHVGTLLAARTFLDYDGNVSELETAVMRIENEMREKNRKELNVKDCS